ncbi:MBL fold metallo-hydrolase [Sphingomonas sp. Leaf10]|uniref:MBL fold metallo-hydrolase n=1 Tax=Sphingomonas sp. Leaf10 TaxID=1735676 RepID=UPI0006F83AA3|nr:MBL fold metallo-hydrolase [Sphingomonas sp. Leaf10]KQM39042.1 MBL fold metallo-hydrolase [Sphingomonas sp. Leaf10]
MADYPTGIAQPLEPLVTRVLARNASPYTHSGTQSFIVGGEGAVAVIDPGPVDDVHLDAIMTAVGGREVAAILCTHTHRDHSPGAAPLAARTGAAIIGCAPLTMDDAGPRSDAAFDVDYRPDRVLGDGEAVAGDGWTLVAVATPGHTSNHLAFALPESGALFSGDHVMGWSTTIVSPPDGDMGDYMASLSKLLDRDDRIYYPAHGDLIATPQRLVRSMLGHRKQREGQIARAIERGTHDVPTMVDGMYVGLAAGLVGAARRSVLAHLIDMERRGIVRQEGDTWHRM